MASDAEIANVALRLIGQTSITSLTEGTTTANIVDDIFSELRDDLLRAHSWNFATKRAELARSVTAPAFEFDYAYPMPADWLRTVSAHNNDAGHGTMLYRVEYVASQLCVVTSESEVFLRYIYKVTDPNLMSSDFRRAFALGLARDLAVPIASSNALQQQLDQQFNRKMAQSRSTDAMGAFPEIRPRGSWASARSGTSDGFQND
jgi:hypothetical protein